jgi:predicted 3-demethylubiquinone-9 3-methyltransferase (glyoxalase superfamily)
MFEPTPSSGHSTHKETLMPTLDKISPCLWFDGRAEEAARFYTDIFKNSEIGRIARYGEAGREITGQKPGTVMTVEFTLEGQSFTALNGGPQFKFNESISFEVACKNQAEIDYFWEKLGAGGDVKAQQCGWLKDKFGLSWQIVPEILPDLMVKGTREQTERTMAALLKMKKLDIAALERAHG